MGCSDSKEAQTKDQSKPTQKPAEKKDDKKVENQEEQAVKQGGQQQQQDGDGATLKTREEAVNYLVEKLDIKKENAERLVDEFVEDGDKLDEKESKEICDMVKKANDELKPMFEDADANKSGKVTSTEASKVLEKLFPKMGERGIKKLLKKFEDDDKYIQYGEFILFVIYLQNARESIRPIFESADENGTGTVTLTEATTRLCEEYPAMDERSVKKMLYRCDSGDGIISYEEFIFFYSNLQQARKRVMKRFEGLDKDGNGQVKESAVIKLLIEETGMEEDDCKALVNSTDEGNDATVSADEFIETWSKLSATKK